MKKSIKIKFINFWDSFDPENNIFTNALRNQRNVSVLHHNEKTKPDILIYSRCGKPEHYKYDCVKIYYTGENDFPNFNECDYAISFYESDCGGRNLRYPLYMFHVHDNDLIRRFNNISGLFTRDFCSLVMSNFVNCAPKRIKLIDIVESYKPIAYGGAFRNNIGGRVNDKIDFISNFKFNLALENSIMPGYVTEKILEPYAGTTIPIYWGDHA